MSRLRLFLASTCMKAELSWYYLYRYLNYMTYFKSHQFCMKPSCSGWKEEEGRYVRLPRKWQYWETHTHTLTHTHAHRNQCDCFLVSGVRRCLTTSCCGSFFDAMKHVISNCKPERDNTFTFSHTSFSHIMIRYIFDMIPHNNGKRDNDRIRGFVY